MVDISFADTKSISSIEVILWFDMSTQKGEKRRSIVRKMYANAAKVCATRLEIKINTAIKD